MAQLPRPSPSQLPWSAPDVASVRRASQPGARDVKVEDDESDHGADGDGDGDDRDGHSDNSDGPVRKRRRSRKGLDKKFECPTEGCGKSYSRAEHLYRHQLNHEPKQIYRCDFQDCNRSFVRLDLCNRHKDRHTAKGSALSRKDSLISQSSPIDNVRSPYPTPGSTATSPNYSRPGKSSYQEYGAHLQYQSPKDALGAPYTPLTNTPPSGFPHVGPPNGVEGYLHEPGYGAARHPHRSPGGRPPMQTSAGPYGVLSPVSTQHGGYHGQPANTPHPQSAPAAPYVVPNNFPPFALPASDFSSSSAHGLHRGSGQQYTSNTSGDYNDQSQNQTSGDVMMLDQMTPQATIPVFGTDGVLNKSPYVSIPEDFVAYLFNANAPDASPSVNHMMPRNQYASYSDSQNKYGTAYYGTDGVSTGYFPPSNQPQQVMSVTNLLDPNLPESLLSEEKSQEVYDYIKDRFHEEDNVTGLDPNIKVLEGDRENEEHMLSRTMMQHYILSFWMHFSDQLPILHKPTFSPDKTPNLLLLAVMAIGAACLDRTHSAEVTRAGAHLSNMLASNLRWAIFMHPEFRPPAKLWIFQTLLLLELYEKMYSTRRLHERAHIHHATTITLMRRGRSLIGKSLLDSPPNSREDRSGGSGSRQSSASGPAHTPDEWWNHWITNEATRRAAFAAFVIDSVHATMFGHSTVMVAHEMRLPLPCDDRLWKATSGAEVGRIESNLYSNGVKPISFLEGLKRTLGGQEVQTNPFGRQILMAGLLSVSWHMNQRDLQISSLGSNVTQALGGRDKWRGTLTKAFDSWMMDFHKSLQRSEPVLDPYSYEKRNEANVVFESRTVLHHLAHMAMHVDIVDCQIFARAKRLLGRAIGQQDLSSAQRRMKDAWAPSAKARDAVFYALKFLCSVLLDTNHMPQQPDRYGSHNQPGISSSSGSGSSTEYVARDDVMLNRPWVLYFAALVVWCYGFALEGPCLPGGEVDLPRGGGGGHGPEERHDAMRAYLRRFGAIETPEDLKNIRGVNGNSALLAVLRDSFASTRWELLHEGAILLSNCMQLNAGVTMI
ncbi:fungal-specific transcription factor domain-containing protein [Xylariaceae sp. FL0804]|nr:fungal-specific transcription factor domain-containing protein [Xylariaceae sp. FL0804]